MLVATLAWRLADIWAKPAGVQHRGPTNCRCWPGLRPVRALLAVDRVDAWPVCWMHACSGSSAVQIFMKAVNCAPLAKNDLDF